MRRVWLVLAVVVALVAACGGGDDSDADAGGGLEAVSGDDGGSDGEGDDGRNGSGSSGDTDTILDPLLVGEYDEADLPGDFDRQWIPPGYEEGAITDFAGLRGVAFAGGFTYVEAIAYYTDVVGPPTFDAGQPPNRVAQWQQGVGNYALQVLESEGEAQVVFAFVAEG